jgi:hypothetical protein
LAVLGGPRLPAVPLKTSGRGLIVQRRLRGRPPRIHLLKLHMVAWAFAWASVWVWPLVCRRLAVEMAKRIWSWRRDPSRPLSAPLLR